MRCRYLDGLVRLNEVLIALTILVCVAVLGYGIIALFV
jgi:hypothetical protein